MSLLFPIGSIARVRRGPIEGHLVQAITFRQYLELKSRTLDATETDDLYRLAVEQDDRVYWKVPLGVTQRRVHGEIAATNLDRMHFVVGKTGQPYGKRWYFATAAKAAAYIDAVIGRNDPEGVHNGDYFLDELTTTEAV